MQKSYAILFTLMTAIIAFLAAPYLTGSTIMLNPSSSILTVASALIWFIIIITSLISLYGTAREKKLTRIVLNGIFSLVILILLFPMAFNSLNLAIFTVVHPEKPGFIGANFLKNQTVCGTTLRVDAVPRTSQFVYLPEDADTSKSYIKILCPVRGSISSYFYKTDKVFSLEENGEQENK